jgi:signal transduction histidine kinase
MKALLTNLLSNAWKYTSRTAAPRVQLQRRSSDNAEVEYTVCDNGVGFSMDRAHELFQPFRRLHSADEFPGIGLGLATVVRIVQRYGGRIWVESEPGKGTSVHFTLPKAEVVADTTEVG